MSLSVPPPSVAKGVCYADREFEYWQSLLEETIEESHTEHGWFETLAVVTAFHLAIPHVECGAMHRKDYRRQLIRRWLCGETMMVPHKCSCWSGCVY